MTPRLNAEFITGGRGQFFEDSKGNLWLTSDALSRIVQKDGKTVLESFDLNLPPKPDSRLIVAEMNETADGSLWLNTSWGIVRRLPDNRTVFYPTEDTISYGNSSMIADKNGRIWLARSNQILVLKPEPLESFPAGEQLIIKSLKVTSVVELKPEGVALMPKKSGEIFQFTNSSLSDFVENSYAKRLFQTSDGDVWITAENNLMQFADGIFHLHSSAEGLPNVMSRMAEDAAGNLWIGGHAGLARLDRQGIVTFGTADGLKSPRIFATSESTDGIMYFAGRDFYLSRFDGTKFQTVRPAINPTANFLWTSRFGMLASNGDWWVLTNERLYRFSGVKDFAELNGKQPTKTYTMADGLESNAIFQIFEDSIGDIWGFNAQRWWHRNGNSSIKKRGGKISRLFRS